MSKKSENGTIRYMWEGKNGTYWALYSYWVGTGWQNVEREVDKDSYELWNI